MNYKLLPDPSKMLPKVFFAEKNIDFYAPSDEILSIRNNSSFTKDGTPQEGFEKKDFNLNDCHKMIDFYKESINKHPEWNTFGFKFKETKEYTDMSEFYKSVSDQGYKLTFQKVNSEYINELVNNGKLYLFKIWNKDFSNYSTGKPNLHTMYWRELFSESNLTNVVTSLMDKQKYFSEKNPCQLK